MPAQSAGTAQKFRSTHLALPRCTRLKSLPCKVSGRTQLLTWHKTCANRDYQHENCTPRSIWQSDAWKGTLLSILAAVCVSLPCSAALEPDPILDPTSPVLDLARVVPAKQEEQLVDDLQSLQQRSGWKLRLLTRSGPSQGPTGEEIKSAWGYDSRTAIVICDPTSPNILQFQAGDSVSQLLRRGFFIELQSRYGNMFYVREEGEAAAVLNTLKAMSTCLEHGGCAVVPGLPENQYQLTLITSLIGGCVFGFSTTIRPQGFVRRRIVWPLLFAPLWGTLFVSFGLGPIITRTQDKLPLLQNFAAFLVAAGVFRLSPLFKASAVDLDLISKEGQKKQDAKDMEE